LRICDTGVLSAAAAGLPRHGLGPASLLASQIGSIAVVRKPSMTLRAFLVAIVFLVGAPAFAVPNRPAPAAVPPAPMVFYVVKGAPGTFRPGSARSVAGER